MSAIFSVIIYIICFVMSFFALSSLDLDKICTKEFYIKRAVLLIMLSLALGYLSANFILNISVYNGL